MSLTTSQLFSEIAVPGGRMSLGYALSLAKDIPEDRWAEMAIEGATHPAFIYGHLAIYPNRIFAGFMGREDLVVPCPFDESNLQAGVDCTSDASRYPSKAVVMPYFESAYERVLETIPELPEARIEAENPIEGFREKLPLAGAAIAFMVNNHIMMHMGQVSHWRRAIGLGPLG